jgi:hypothetical protein
MAISSSFDTWSTSSNAPFTFGTSASPPLSSSPHHATPNYHLPNMTFTPFSSSTSSTWKPLSLLPTIAEHKTAPATTSPLER